MSKPKVVHSLLLFFLLSAITSLIFFIFSLQLSPLLKESARLLSSTAGSRAAVRAHGAPTPTMPALTLDMLLTAGPTAAPIVPTEPAAILLPTPTADARLATINDALVNLRSYPSLAGEVVGQAKQGDRLEIVSTSHDGRWVQVCCPLGNSESSVQSWVSVEFLVIEARLPAKLAANQAQNSTVAQGIPGTVNGSLVNLRSGPATTYGMVGQVPENTQVTITGRNRDGTWWRVCCPNDGTQEMWINAEFIDVTIAREHLLEQVPVVLPPAAVVLPRLGGQQCSTPPHAELASKLAVQMSMAAYLNVNL
ncbi:MAG: SH3 domain-containing protein [Caldilineaceae bacterium]|nr:SH3 domain-containing protein [Caldilineaceae bacterium]